MNYPFPKLDPKDYDSHVERAISALTYLVHEAGGKIVIPADKWKAASDKWRGKGLKVHKNEKEMVLELVDFDKYVPRS